CATSCTGWRAMSHTPVAPSSALTHGQTATPASATRCGPSSSVLVTCWRPGSLASPERVDGEGPLADVHHGGIWLHALLGEPGPPVDEQLELEDVAARSIRSPEPHIDGLTAPGFDGAGQDA